MAAPGYVGNLNSKQESALQELKKTLGSTLQPHMDDHYLLRWLRARKFDVKKSFTMLNTSLQWRKSFGADGILESFQIPEVLQKYFPGGVYGFDREGYPIAYQVIGEIDVKGMSVAVRRSDVLKERVWYLENLNRIMDQQTAKLGRKISEVTLIFDLDNFGLRFLWKPVVDLFTQVLSLIEANYPEMLRKCYVINAPRLLPVLWNIAKPLLHEETRKKIQFCKGDFKSALLADIDADQLPVHWGGAALGENNDPFCGIKMGGMIPEELKVGRLDPTDMEGFTAATVGRGSSLQVTTEVKVAESVIRWQFQTDGSDIGFGIYRKTRAGQQAVIEMESAVIQQRVNSHMVPEEGSYKCDTPGTYVAYFDNTYSWVSSKKLSYLIEVLEPTSEMEVTSL